MKKLVSFLVCSIILLPSLFSQTKTIDVKVDERVELISIVSYLAGYNEYNNAREFSEFTKSVDEYFKPYLNDTLVSYAKYIREERGIGYDAPMIFAVDLVIDNNIHFNPQTISKAWVKDQRWTQENANHYLSLLNEFYKKTKFREFYNKNKSFYSKLEEGFSPIIKSINLDWFDSFYSQKTNNSFTVILCPINGPSNYGPSIIYKDGKEDVYSIMGSWMFDSIFHIDNIKADGVNETLIHEFNHSFCNPMVEKYWKELEKNAGKIFKLVEKEMSNQAYGDSKTMTKETLVRTATIKYLTDNTKKEAKRHIRYEEKNSFFCVNDIYKALNTYSQDRIKYPNFESYMPQLCIEFNNIKPKTIKKLIKNFFSDFKIETSIKDGATNVPSSTNQLIVKFNKQMLTSCNGTSYGRKAEDKYFPKFISAKWNEDTKKEWVIEIKLEPNTEYSISFPYQFFYDSEGKQGKNDKFLYLDFKTGK
jgi:hypothetical protein